MAARQHDARDAYVHQALNFQELRGYQNGNDVRRVQLRRRQRVLQVMHEPLENVNVTVHTDWQNVTNIAV
jgi:hypothetical protein